MESRVAFLFSNVYCPIGEIWKISLAIKVYKTPCFREIIDTNEKEKDGVSMELMVPCTHHPILRHETVEPL